MSINGLFYDLRAQKAKNYRTWMKKIFTDGILNGCALSNTDDSITLGVGHFVASGAITEIDVAETTTLLTPIENGYVRLYYQIDLTQTPSKTVFNQGSMLYDYAASLGAFSALTTEDINDDGDIYEIEIAVYTMVSSVCTALVRNIADAEIIGAGGSTALDSEPDDDVTVSGISAQFTASANLAFGDVCYVDSNGKAALIDADAIASMTGIMMCADATISADATGSFLMVGFARKDAWSWTVGGKIYGTVTGTTGNTMGQAAPTGTNDVVQILGVATHADRIYFNPQLVQVEVK